MATQKPKPSSQSQLELYYFPLYFETGYFKVVDERQLVCTATVTARNALVSFINLYKPVIVDSKYTLKLTF